jgi:hypothetical protein
MPDAENLLLGAVCGTDQMNIHMLRGEAIAPFGANAHKDFRIRNSILHQINLNKIV